jgi:hypothetical protein
MRYTKQAYLSIDNNLAERMLRQVALGRNNWQLCGSAEGGKTAAVLYTVIGACKHLGIDLFAYLRAVLPALVAPGINLCEEALTSWLPDAWQKGQQDSCRGGGTLAITEPEEAPI